MPLSACFLCSVCLSLVDLICTLAISLERDDARNWPLCMQLVCKLLAYVTVNLVCLYTKYLIDLAQRNAFLETRRSIETRAKIERENDKQERLLLSLLPRFVALEIIADIAKEDNHDKLLKNQFHKIYIHSYSNVR